MSKSAQAIANEVARECVMTRWRTTNRVLAAVYDEELRPFGLKCCATIWVRKQRQSGWELAVAA